MTLAAAGFALTALFHPVPLSQVTHTPDSHVVTCGRVEYNRKESDGDRHINIGRDGKTLVTEISPYLPMAAPVKGKWIEVWGFPRRDPEHGWPEINPIVGWRYVKGCG